MKEGKAFKAFPQKTMSKNINKVKKTLFLILKNVLTLPLMGMLFLLGLKENVAT